MDGYQINQIRQEDVVVSDGTGGQRLDSSRLNAEPLTTAAQFQHLYRRTADVDTQHVVALLEQHFDVSRVGCGRCPSLQE